MKFTTPLLIAALALPMAPAFAQDARDYPARPIRMILPYPPGGGVDANGRLLAKALSGLWNKPVVVENMAGATTTIATKAIVQAKPDGYTIGLITSQLAINPSLFKGMPYKSSDYQLVTQMVEAPLYVAVNPKTTPTTLGELLKYAKEHPNGVSYASAGPGSITNLPVEMLQEAAGLQFKQVPYLSGAASIAAVVSGEVNLTYAAYPPLKPMVKDGRLKIIAVAGDARTTLLRDVPAIKEAAPSYKGVSEWYGIIVPKGTPRPIIDKLYADVKKALGTKELAERLVEDGNIVVGSAPEEFGTFVTQQSALWEKTITKLGLSLDLK